MTRSIPARAALDRRDPVAPSQASTTHRAFPVVGDRGGEVDVRDPREHGPHDEPELARGGRLRHSPQLVGARRRLDRRGRVHRPDCPSHEAPIALRAVRRPRAHGLVDPLRRPLAGRDLVIRLRLVVLRRDARRGALLPLRHLECALAGEGEPQAPRSARGQHPRDVVGRHGHRDRPGREHSRTALRSGEHAHVAGEELDAVLVHLVGREQLARQRRPGGTPRSSSTGTVSATRPSGTSTASAASRKLSPVSGTPAATGTLTSGPDHRIDARHGVGRREVDEPLPLGRIRPRDAFARLDPLRRDDECHDLAARSARVPRCARAPPPGGRAPRTQGRSASDASAQEQETTNPQPTSHDPLPTTQPLVGEFSRATLR